MRKRAQLVGRRRYLVALPQHIKLLATGEALGDESNRLYRDELSNGTREGGQVADRNGKHRGNVWQHLSQYLDTVACIERAKLKRNKHTRDKTVQGHPNKQQQTHHERQSVNGGKLGKRHPD
jgi:hypothetical protein